MGYTGIGWSFLWLTSALWAHRLLNIHFHLSGAVVIPTIFSIVIFLGMYIVLVRKFETRRALRLALNGVQLVKRADVAAAATKMEASVAYLDAQVRLLTPARSQHN